MCVCARVGITHAREDTPSHTHTHIHTHAHRHTHTHTLSLSLSTATTNATPTSPPSTRLRFDIIAPPDEDNCELDGSDCEESVFARKKRERQAGETKLREKYTEAGLKLSDIDRMETPDMYNAGGMNGIIPGVQLSTLMEDD